MAYHPDSFHTIEFLKKEIEILENPLSAILWETWEPGDDTPDAKNSLYIGFFTLSLYLAQTDLHFSMDELYFFRDIQKLFGEDDNTLDSYLLKNAYENSIKNRPELFQKPILLAPIVYLKLYDNQNGTNFSDRAKGMYFKFANAFVKADGSISLEEENALKDIKQLYFDNNSANAISEVAPSIDFKEKDDEKIKPLDELIDNLHKLIGLQKVKTDVSQLVNFLKVQKLREEKGMAKIPVSRHLVFYGNPGTGKTTIARLLAQIYKSLNLISRGQLIETDRAGLVAGFVGQTALKVKEVVESALGGVLFIDEAYSLSGEGQDYGREAIDTLIKLMEDNRDDLIVIVAGYTDKMSKFLSSNPGLFSRFNKYFYFDDYTPNELIDIYELFCSDAGYVLTCDAKEKMLAIFQLFYDMKDETFGNARFARNVFEQTINTQANRIISLSNLNEAILSTILPEDIPGEIEIHTLQKI